MGHVASEVSPRGTHPCCVASRPATLTPRPKPAGFQAAECRSSALLTGWVRSQFGTVSLVSDQQALAGLSWLNFSPPVDLPLVAGIVGPEWSSSPKPCSPRWLALHEPDAASRPHWLEPRGWIQQSTRHPHVHRITFVTTDEHQVAGSRCLQQGTWRSSVFSASPTLLFTAARSCTARSVSVVPPPMRNVMG